MKKKHTTGSDLRFGESRGSEKSLLARREKKLETQESELEDQLKRALADYQNLEKRITNEKSEWIKLANRELIMKLLPILDDLFLAQKHIQDEGLDLSVQKFQDILEGEGVKGIETRDKKFDPNTMECVGVIAGEENKVLEEVRSGFIINDRVLRPAQVVVGRQQN